MICDLPGPGEILNANLKLLGGSAMDVSTAANQ